MSSAPPAILYLHALPLDGTMWKNQFDLFPAKSYAPTLYHCGPLLTDWASEALNLIEEERIIVVGCSIGGSCALELTQLAQDRVTGIVLIGTKAHRTPDPEFLEIALRQIRLKGKQAAWETYWGPLFSANCPTSALEAAEVSYLSRTVDELIAGTQAFHSRPSRQELLKTYKGEITFVSGVQDTAPGVKATRQQSQAARFGSCHLVPDCGHYVPLEAPDQLNAILKQHLTKHFLK